MQNKILNYSVGISLLVHSAIIFLPGISAINSKSQLLHKDVKINYYVLDQEIKKTPQLSAVKNFEKDKEPTKKVDDLSSRPKINIKDVQVQAKNELTKNENKDIVLPDLPKNYPNRPQYMNYYQIVRERIKLYTYRNYVGTSVGEVFLEFTLSSKGMLKNLEIVNANSKATEFLKRVALKSVREAEPYPGFPAQIVQDELKFNIVISFELND